MEERKQKLVNILEKIRFEKLGESLQYQRELTLLEQKVIRELKQLV